MKVDRWERNPTTTRDLGSRELEQTRVLVVLEEDAGALVVWWWGGAAMVRRRCGWREGATTTVVMASEPQLPQRKLLWCANVPLALWLGDEDFSNGDALSTR